MAGNYETGKQGVAILPLALIVLLHLGLLLWWMTTTRPSVAPIGEQRSFIMTWLPPLTPRAPALPPRERAPAAVIKPRTAQAPRVQAPVPAPGTPPLSAEHEVPPESSAPAVPVPEERDAAQMLAMAKRQAGMVDRELRGGKPAVLSPDPQLPITRLREALAGAHLDRARVMVTDSYTQADGVVIYRFQYAGKVWCRQSGGIGPGIEPSDGAKLAGAGSRGGAGQAGNVACPGGAVWTRR